MGRGTTGLRRTDLMVDLMATHSNRLGALLALLLGGAGCIGSSVPQPPNHRPLEPTLVTRSSEEATGYRLAGGPGSAEPNAELWVWDLDSDQPPLVTPTNEAGAFTVGVPATATELRLQTRDGDDRSTPIDIVPDVLGSAPVRRPECFHVALELFLEGRAGELLLENVCEVEVSLVDAALRATTAFSVETPTELRLPSGARAMLRVTAPGDAPIEDILFVTVDVRGSPVRYPVTLIAPAR